MQYVPKGSIGKPVTSQAWKFALACQIAGQDIACNDPVLKAANRFSSQLHYTFVFFSLRFSPSPSLRLPTLLRLYLGAQYANTPNNFDVSRLVCHSINICPKYPCGEQTATTFVS